MSPPHPLINRLLRHGWKVVIDADNIATRAEMLRPDGGLSTSTDVSGVDAQAALNALEVFMAASLADEYNHQITKPKIQPPSQ
jgi:hypothetical protein